MMVRLPAGSTLVGATLAGIPSALAVIAGLHWVGAAVAVIVFAVWCSRLPSQDPALSG
jgi:hypothetical protein